ncbi:DDE-type integrase/transposase/recombinase [Kocuria sp. CPCC 205268]|uniref:DDE-type integrase/transposase/recombinase n=1 Tax=Kocuria oxytropis TaxID=3058913 RepID=UPI0034D50E2A
MSTHLSPAEIRMAIVDFPADAPRGAVTRFCAAHAISRSQFYKIRALAAAQGAGVALQKGSTAARTHPNRTPPAMAELALSIRAELTAAGWDAGPVSVAAKIRRAGFTPPAPSTLARIFTTAGVVVPAPKKRPKTSYKRFVYPAPNCCWQIDATAWALAEGAKAVVFQVLDDHSRYCLASLAATGETSHGALAVVQHAVATAGVPQKVLSDNGPALNPTRYGHRSLLVDYLRALGVEPITGRPNHPRTQGKNERIHQTLQRYLGRQPPAATLAQLQAQVEAFDRYYNHDREHQALPKGMTPAEAWEATPAAAAPTPPAAAPQPTATTLERTATPPAGKTTVHGTTYLIGHRYIGQTIHVLLTETTIGFYDHEGTEILTHPRPPAGTTYVGNTDRTQRPSTKP